MTYILRPSDPVETHDRFGGGKAANLARLTAAGVRVPDWFCVTTRAFEASLRHGDGDAADMPDAVRHAILEELERHGFGDRFLAVRSSGADEDSPDDSFAGLFASFLYQRGHEAVLRSVRRCWAAAFSERLQAYRQRRGLSPDRIRMGVVIQAMVDADAAGVAFSRDPVRPLDRDTLVVASVFGLGEGLVSGALDADHFQVGREGFTVSPAIADKPFAVRRAAEGGVRQEALPEHLRRSASLTDAQVAEVARMALDLEARFGRPQDCEWAFANGTLYCLQTRPITTLPPDDFFDGAARGETPALWDNSNITESYGGVTLPLTFTFVSHCYRVVYRRFCEAMGMPARLLDEKAMLFENLLGLIRGRVYYNLIQYYHLMALGPGVQHRREFMETMMGLKQQLRPDLAARFDVLAETVRYRPWELLRIAGRVLWYFVFLDRAVARFRGSFDAVYADAHHSDFRSLSLPEQASRYRDLERAVLERWVEPLIVDFFCMIFFGLLKRLTRRWITTDASSLQNDLLAGQRDIESTEPTRLLMTIAATVAASDAAFREWFLAASPAALWQDLPARDARIHRLLLDYLDRFGFRCADELKLEARDLTQDPTFLLDVLRSYVRAGQLGPGAMERREEEVRLAAEATVRTRISGWRRRVYVWVLGNARRAVRHRENLRFLRTRIFGVVRRLFGAMAQHLVAMGALRDPDDVFYLTLDEILAFVDGRSLVTRFDDLVALRRREFDDYRRSAAPPDRFLTLGAVGASARYTQVLADGDLLNGDGTGDGDPDLLRGTPCFPGVVEGVVRVARDIRDAMGVNGEILATQRTDPGWFPLYPFCSALLIERGSLLSHSAIVAREFGVPTIVGITGGMMQRLRTGQRLLVDGGRGQIRILPGDGDTP